MEVILSAAISLDGYLDDCSPERLRLSSTEDWQAVARLRARCDAILVGANTVRRDNPSLIIKDDVLRAERVLKGMPADITKVTVTSSGCLDPASRFFTVGDGQKVVFASADADNAQLQTLKERATVISESMIDPSVICDRLESLGVTRLMVEGGTGMLSMFLASGYADRLRLAIAPFFVGDPQAPRFVDGTYFPWNKDCPMKVESIEKLGDTTIINLTKPGKWKR